MEEFILKKRSILFHIIVTYFTCGIWAIIYLYYKTKRNKCYNSSVNNSQTYNNDEFENLFGMNRENYDKANKLNEKYDTIIKKHYEYIEKIGMAYTIANNLSLPDSPEMQKVIELCLQDIALAPAFSEYCKEMAKLYNQNEYITNYSTFQRLAIIYEKQKKYQKAIEVCQQAIQLGFYKDGTTGQMPGRLARLIKKANKENIQLQK